MADMSALLTFLSTLFAAENRPGGDAAAKALTEIAATNPPLVNLEPPVDTSALAQVFEHAPNPQAAALKDTILSLDWHYSGLADGRIREDIARHMLTTEIIGRNAMLPCDHLRVGFFFQQAGLDYVTRVHAAEETFIMVAGAADWRCFDTTTPRKTGDIIFHPSMAPHASVTHDQPLLAAWRWTGDIGYDLYKLTG